MRPLKVADWCSMAGTAVSVRVLKGSTKPATGGGPMKVSELLRARPAAMVTVEPKASLATAASLIMERGIGGLPVVQDGGPVTGFVSERDLVNALHRNPQGVGALLVKDIMRHPPPVCSGSDAVQAVMARMTRERLRHLVVIDAGRAVGVLSVGDILKHRLEQLETETGVLRDYVAGQRARR